VPLAVGLGSRSQALRGTGYSDWDEQGLSDIGSVDPVDQGSGKSGYFVPADHISHSQGSQEVAARIILGCLGFCGVFRTGSRKPSQVECHVSRMGGCGGFGRSDLTRFVGFGYGHFSQKEYTSLNFCPLQCNETRHRSSCAADCDRWNSRIVIAGILHESRSSGTHFGRCCVDFEGQSLGTRERQCRRIDLVLA
jgi:hypothetical protein